MQQTMNNSTDIRTETAPETDFDKQSPKFSLWKRIAVFIGALIVAFLLGLIPMWLSTRETAEQRDAAQANLRLSQMQNRLATAAIDARRGEYEQARMHASDFYTDLRAELERTNSAVTVPQQREQLQPVLAQRDEVITLLARSDPASSERLADLYLAYKQAISPPAPTPSN